MKKIYFGPKGTEKWHEPFWKPWGCLGCLGRLLLYLVLLFTLMFLLNMFKMCSCSIPSVQIPEDILNPIGDPLPRVPIDTMVNFPRDITNPGENLPSPDENYIPPYDDEDVITDDSTHQQIVANKLNVMLDDPSTNDETFNQWANEFKQLYPDENHQVVYYDPLTRLIQIEIPADERESIMQNLPNQITDISFKIFPEGLIGNLDVPNDPVFAHEETNWYFAPIQAYEAWDITKGSPNVTVAIVDSYFDLNHDDLNSDRIVHPYSIPRKTGNVAPAEDADEACFEHGSMVASQALGTCGNSRGTSGIAPGCKFMPISMGHRFTSMTMLQGVLYAIYQGADVVNISAGSVFDPSIHNCSIDEQIQISQTMCQEEAAIWNWVFELADARNVTIVWAAGNDDILASLDPSKRGCEHSTINVSAVDRDLSKASFSNFGHLPEKQVEVSTISAPGVDILGAKPYNTYDIGPGTSFAAPIVTGAVALMKSVDPTLSNSEIVNILQETGKEIPGNDNIGKLLQIKDALEKVKDNFVSMSDLQNDHSQFIGLWQSTQMLYRIDENGQNTNQEIRLYFNITSEDAGEVIYYEAGYTKKDFVGPLAVHWQPEQIVLESTDKATCDTENRNYTAATFYCIPNSEGLLQCQHSTATQSSSSAYFLRKVRDRND